MSSWEEIDRAYNILNKKGHEVAVLQCTTEYPCPLNKIGLNNIEEIKKRYKCASGLSDHSGKISPSLLAYAQSHADLIEVHVTYNRDAFGPDASSSLTFDELSRLNELIGEMYMIKTNPTSKDKISQEKNDLKKLFGRSIYYKNDMHQGEMIQESDLEFKKPGKYVSAEKCSLYIGKKLKEHI